MREQCVVRLPDGPSVWFDRHKKAKKPFQSSRDLLAPGVEPNALMLPLVGGDTRFNAVFRFLASMRVYSIQPSRLREMQDPDGGTSLRPDGGNTASVLQEIERDSKETSRRLCELLETITPQTKRVKAKKHGNKLSLEFTQEWGEGKKLKFEAFNMSDGTLRALGLLAAVHQRPSPSVVVIEEPESTIRPGALGAVLDLLRDAGHRMQVVVTTHSPELLDADWIEDRHLRVVDWEEGATRVGGLAESSRRAIQEHLMGAGQLLRSNALNVDRTLFDERYTGTNANQMFLFEEGLE